MKICIAYSLRDPILYGIMTEELVIRDIRIDEAAGRGDSDSRMTSLSLCHLNSNQSPIIKYIALSQLVICKNEWRVHTREKLEGWSLTLV